MLDNNLNSNENNNTIKGDDNMNNLQDLAKLINGISAFLKEVQGITSLEEQAVNQLGKVLADNLGLVKEIETVKVETKEVIPTEVQEELALLKDDNEKLTNQIKSLEEQLAVAQNKEPEVIVDSIKINELQAKIDEQESIIEQLAECVEASNTVIEQQKAELEEATRIMQFALNEINELNKLQNEEDSDNEIADFESDDEDEIDNIQDDLEQQSDELDEANNDEDMVHSDSNSEEIDTDGDILDFIMETESKTVEELSFDEDDDKPVVEEPKPKAKTRRNTGFKSNGFEPAIYINEDTSNNDEIFEKQLSYMDIIEEDTYNDDALFEEQLLHMNIETETCLESNNIQEAKPRRTNRKQSQYDQYGNPRETRSIKSEFSNDTTTAMDYLKRVKANEVNFEYILANRKEFEDMCTLWLSINMNQLPIEISNLKVELFKYDLENTNLED